MKIYLKALKLVVLIHSMIHKLHLIFNLHGTINKNLNIENILNQFKELIVKSQDLQASCCKSINVTSPNNLTKPDFPDITDVDDEIVWKKGTVLITGNSILSGLRESKMSKWRLIKVRSFPGARIRDMFFYLVPL